MAQTKYLELISKSKEAKEQEQLAEAAEYAKSQIGLDILAGKKAVREAEKAVESTVTSTPFNSDAVIRAQRTLANAKEDLAALQTIETEYFTEGE